MVLRYKEQLGAEIRRRRLELGLSQKDVAEAAHVKEPQTISRWERGISLPSDLEAVAGALRTSIPELMAGIAPPARLARKLELEPRPPASQLDRIEGRLEELHAMLSDPAGAARAAAALGARAVEAAGSIPPPAREPPARREAAPRRKSA